MKITLDQFKEYRQNEMIKHYSEGSLIDEGLDFILLDIFHKAGTKLLIDIGANQGNWIKYSQEKYPDLNILAFEPDARIFKECLEKYNGIKNIELHNKGILNKNTKMNFYFDSDSTQTSIKYSSSKSYMIIKCEKLDKYFDSIKKFDKPFIKIDAEGVEPEIIYSAKKIIKNMESLVLYFEYSYKWNYNEKEIYDLFKYLIQSGFILYRLNAFGLERIPNMYADFLKQYHFSNIFAMKGYRFHENDIEFIPSRFGGQEMFTLVKEREIEFKEKKTVKE